MTEEQLQQATLAARQAACAGFAQELINRGYDENIVKQATIAYAHPQEGLLTKRANNIAMLHDSILAAVAQLRGY